MVATGEGDLPIVPPDDVYIVFQMNRLKEVDSKVPMHESTPHTGRLLIARPLACFSRGRTRPCPHLVHAGPDLHRGYILARVLV